MKMLTSRWKKFYGTIDANPEISKTAAIKKVQRHLRAILSEEYYCQNSLFLVIQVWQWYN